jgi:hypothetical protein
MTRTIPVPLWVLLFCIGSMVFAAGWIAMELLVWRPLPRMKWLEGCGGMNRRSED